MAKNRLLLLIVFLVAGCTSSQNWYDDAGSGPTPESWKSIGFLAFVVFDEDSEPLGTFKIQLTSEYADKVGSNTWFSARLVESDLPTVIPDVWLSNPSVTSAYLITGDRLDVNLNSSMLDDNIVLRGKLIENGAIGVIYHSSPLGGEVFGRFTAVMSFNSCTKPALFP